MVRGSQAREEGRRMLFCEALKATRVTRRGGGQVMFCGGEVSTRSHLYRETDKWQRLVDPSLKLGG